MMTDKHPWDKRFGWFDRLARRIRPHMPFTALNTVRRHIDSKSASMLDVGCGKGEPMESINRHGELFAVGADGFQPYLRECRTTGLYQGHVLCDIRHLPFRDKSFDIVLCMEVLEHQDQNDGIKLLKSLERIARRQVILTTPAGDYDQHPYDDNPRQLHKHIWKAAGLEEQGYVVRGCGLPRLGGEGGLVSMLPRFLKPVVFVVWVLAGPLVYYRPQMAGSLICIKNFDTAKTNNTRNNT